MSSDSSRVTDELWEEFHRVVNMTSRELRDRLIVRTVHVERREDLEPTAGQAAWRHKLMSIGHDPLEPAD
jgi:hypothetical protein